MRYVRGVVDEPAEVHLRVRGGRIASQEVTQAEPALDQGGELLQVGEVERLRCCTRGRVSPSGMRAQISRQRRSFWSMSAITTTGEIRSTQLRSMSGGDQSPASRSSIRRPR